MTIKRIHVNRHRISKNLKCQSYEPAITVKHGKRNLYGHEVLILDDSGNIVARVIQPKDKKLNCGARIWIESSMPVQVINRNDGSAEDLR